MKSVALFAAVFSLSSAFAAAATDYRPYALCENVFWGDIANVRIERSETAKNLRIVLIDDFDGRETLAKNAEGGVLTVTDAEAASKNTVVFLGEPVVDGWPMHLFFEFGPEVERWDFLAEWGDVMRASETPDAVYPDFRCRKL